MNIIKTIYREITEFGTNLSKNAVGAYSAQAAFFVITSFFPFMLLTVTLIRFTPLDTIDIAAMIPVDMLDTTTGEMVSAIIQEIWVRAAPGALLGVAGISAIWAASRCLMSIIQGLNKVYSAESKRGWLKLRLVSMVYVFALQIMIIVTMGILVFGEQINNWFIYEFNLQILNELMVELRWVIGLFLLILFFMSIYTVVPERKTRLLSEMPGAVLSAVGWLGFSGLFSMYIDNFSDFGAVYGSLAAAVVVMLWLYFCMYILFLGAQFNVTLHNKSISKVTVKQFINRGKTP